MKFPCPHCQQKLDAPQEYSGMVINCPACQGQIQVPTMAPPPPPLSINRPATTVPFTAPPPLAAQSTSAASTEFPDAAPLVKRIVAKVLDGILQILLFVGLSIGWSFAAKALASAGTSHENIFMISTVVLAALMLLPFFYNYLPLAGSGATPGKKMLSLVVVRQNRQRLGYAWALLRVLTESVCVAACYGIALLIFIGVERAQMQSTHLSAPQYTPSPMHQPGTRFAPSTPPRMYSDNRPVKMLLTMPVFLLILAPYVPAFFTKGRRATHDLIVRTMVISR